jgi:hypothetical protein
MEVDLAKAIHKVSSISFPVMLNVSRFLKSMRDAIPDGFYFSCACSSKLLSLYTFRRLNRKVAPLSEGLDKSSVSAMRRAAAVFRRIHITVLRAHEWKQLESTTRLELFR